MRDSNGSLLKTVFVWIVELWPFQDLGLAQNSATATLSPNPMGSLAHQIYRMMCNSGFAKKDFASVFLFLQEQQKKSWTLSNKAVVVKARWNLTKYPIDA